MGCKESNQTKTKLCVCQKLRLLQDCADAQAPQFLLMANLISSKSHALVNILCSAISSAMSNDQDQISLLFLYSDKHKCDLITKILV